MSRTSPTIFKLYISNFLTGLVFWYGIEKLFLSSIGIGPADIGWMLAAYTVLALILDIPAGILADRWSRKGTLVIAIVCLALSALFQGASTDTTLYLIGYLFYAVYLVCTSGTYHALVYDTAYEEGQADKYSKIMGKAYALFLCGAGVANMASGFLGAIDLRLPFWLTLVPCVINIALILSIKEPQFHKSQQKSHIILQLGDATKAILRVALLRSLVGIYTIFAVSELFKQDFSQLYFLAFNNQAVLLGMFWAAYAFAWAFGNLIAHRIKDRLNLLLIISFGTLPLMSVWHSPWALGIFLVQAAAAAAAHILIETQVQNSTPSAVRASTLSVLATSERLVRLPGSFLFGWLIAQYDIFAAVAVVAVSGIVALIYWLLIGLRRLNRNQASPEITEHYAQI
jgi:MFS family permease